jgi:hypothetical protein
VGFIQCATSTNKARLLSPAGFLSSFAAAANNIAAALKQLPNQQQLLLYEPVLLPAMPEEAVHKAAVLLCVGFLDLYHQLAQRVMPGNCCLATPWLC